MKATQALPNGNADNAPDGSSTATERVTGKAWQRAPEVMLGESRVLDYVTDDISKEYILHSGKGQKGAYGYTMKIAV